MAIILMLRHLGPGPHPSGTPQAVHGKKSADQFVAPAVSAAQAPVAQPAAVPVAVQPVAQGQPTVPVPFKFAATKSAEMYVTTHKLAQKAILAGCNPDTAANIVRALEEVSKKCGVKPLALLTTSSEIPGKGTAMVTGTADGEGTMSVDADDFVRLAGPDGVYDRTVVHWDSLRKDRAKVARREQQLMDKEFGKVDKGARAMMEADLAEEAKYNRFSVAYKGTGTDTVVYHEFGHYIYNLARYFSGNASDFENTWARNVGQMLEDKSIYNVSLYGGRSGHHEAFAESFVMYMYGEKDKLPKYATDFIDHALWLARH